MCSIDTPKMGLWNGADKLYFGIGSITQFGDAAILWFRFIRCHGWRAAVSRMPDRRLDSLSQQCLFVHDACLEIDQRRFREGRRAKSREAADRQRAEHKTYRPPH